MVGGGAAAPIPPPKGEGGERSEPGGVRAASDGASDLLKCKTHRGLAGEIVRIEGSGLVARTPPGRALRARPPSPFGGGISKAAPELINRIPYYSIGPVPSRARSNRSTSANSSTNAFAPNVSAASPLAAVA